MPSTNTHVRAHRNARALHAVPDPTPAGRTAAEDKLWAALHAHPAHTTSDLATHAGIGRSTAGKILAAWATDGSVIRTSGPTEAERRAADTWTITDITQDHATEQADCETTGAAPDSDADATGDADAEEIKASDPGVAEQPTTSATPTGTGTTVLDDKTAPVQTMRLGKGALRGMVEDYLTERPGEQFSPEVREFANSEVPTDGNRWANGQSTGVESPGLGNRSDLSLKVSGTKPRRGKGELRALVLEVLRERVGAEVSPVEIGRALSASPGAVVNACGRLVSDGQARLASARPRRYSVVANSSGADG